MRKAVADGLEPASVLKVKRKKRNIPLTKASEAIEPELPEEIRARLSNLQDEER